MSITTIKLHLPQGEVRRVPADAVNFNSATALRELVGDLNSSYKTTPFALCWRDEDGDIVTIGSDIELQVAVSFFQETDTVARFFVRALDEPRISINLEDILGSFCQRGPRRCYPRKAAFRASHCPGQWRCQEQPSQASEGDDTAAESTAASGTDTPLKNGLPGDEWEVLDHDLEAAIQASLRTASPKGSVAAAATPTPHGTVFPSAAAASETTPPPPPPMPNPTSTASKPQQAQPTLEQAHEDGDEQVPLAQLLQSMGFTQDTSTLKALLRRHGGKIAGVVAELLNTPQSQR